MKVSHIHLRHGAAQQRGVVAVLTAVLLFAMVAFGGLLLDAGGAFYNHSRLQIAADACALGGVRQLDGSVKGLSRAEDAGISIGKVNLADFYDADTVKKIKINVLFGLDLTESSFASASGTLKDARYVRCVITSPTTLASGILSAVSDYSLQTKATAKMENAASVCAIPLAVCARETAVSTTTPSSCTCPAAAGATRIAQCTSSTQACGSGCTTGQQNTRCTTTLGVTTTSYVAARSDDPRGPWGYYKGEWTLGPPNSNPGNVETGLNPSGNFNWAAINGKNGASNLAEAMTGPGFCDIDPNNTTITLDTSIGNNGAINKMADAWNYRFGILKGTGACSNNKDLIAPDKQPDFTGADFDPAVYTPIDSKTDNGQVKQIYKVYDRVICPSGVPCNYKEARSNNTPASACSITQAEYAAYGKNRRIVALPVVKCTDWSVNGSQNATIQGWMCGLMVMQFQNNNGGGFPGNRQPIEVLGNLNDPGSPCGQIGTPAKNSIGGLVPTLVQ